VLNDYCLYEKPLVPILQKKCNGCSSNFNILVGYQIFTFFNWVWMSMFPYICYLFISQILTNAYIKIQKIHLPIMLGAGFFLG
jgi:hypothetical protein